MIMVRTLRKDIAKYNRDEDYVSSMVEEASEWLRGQLSRLGSRGPGFQVPLKSKFDS